MENMAKGPKYLNKGPANMGFIFWENEKEGPKRPTDKEPKTIN